MTARIDAARREIECDGRRVPFRLDLREDAATLTLDGCDYRVAPLRWREKATLARFAAAAPELLREELLRLCVTPEPPPHDALTELARWMNDRADGQPVPFDSQSVAGVTLQLCRALHLPPSEFDGMRAVDVEALWQALGTSGGSDVHADEASTKIVIVPDPPAPSAPPPPPTAAPAAPPPSGGLRFRVLNAPPSPAPSLRSGAPSPADAGEGRGERQRRRNAAVPAAGPAASTPPEPTPSVIPSVSEGPGGAGGAHEPALGAGGRERPPLHNSSPLVTFGANALDAAPRIEPIETSSDREALLDELADQLERAAADMGIGEE